MKIILLLLCIAGGIYYWYFCNTDRPVKDGKKSTSAASTDKTAEQASQSSNSARTFKANSLGQQLSSLNDTIYFSDVNKVDIQTLRKKLSENSQGLARARTLAAYNELGEIKDQTDVEILPHMNGFSIVSTYLIASGKVLAADKKYADAEKDFALAANLQKVFLKGAFCSIELFSVHSWSRRLYTAVRDSSLSKAAKKRSFANVPKRKDYAAVLPRIMARDKASIMACKKKSMNNPSMDITEVVGKDKYAQQMFKKMSAERLEEILEKGFDQICEEFAAGRLSRNTKINVGSDAENKFVTSLYNTYWVTFLTRIK